MNRHTALSVVVLTVPLPGVVRRSRIAPVVRLREYYQDPNTPRAHEVLPAAFAAVRNSAGQLLLVRRIDDGNWELPGGRIEVGETAATTVVREVAEESGITIELTGLAGVYSDPTHVLVDPDDTIHQQLALCFHAVPAAPTDADQPRPDHDETDAAAWFSTGDIDNLKIHPAMQLRIDHALGGESQNCAFDQ
jgi:ADP-ribose pyrophosphatase YjhB (NUDIX family)